MKIFLAGQHTYPGLIAEIIGGGSGEVFVKQGAKAAMKIFMAGGESRHWIQDELLDGVKKNETRRMICESFLQGGI